MPYLCMGVTCLAGTFQSMQTIQTAPAAVDLADPTTCHLLRPAAAQVAILVLTRNLGTLPPTEPRNLTARTDLQSFSD